MQTEYLGVVNGLKTWIVRNEAGEIIGKNETPEYDTLEEFEINNSEEGQN
jgi:hypothetical protein